MSFDNEVLLSVARTQAWERSKGELCSMLHTFYGGYVGTSKSQELQTLINEFVSKVEDKSLHK